MMTGFSTANNLKMASTSRSKLLSGNVWPQKTEKSALKTLREAIPVIPPGYKSSPDKKTADEQSLAKVKRPFSNPTNTTDQAEKENQFKSYMDSGRNLHKKKKFSRDNYVTALSVPADSDSDSIEETPAHNDRFSFMGNIEE